MKRSHTVEYEVFDNYAELGPGGQQLVEKALEASRNAYAPYSSFHVGAALLLDDGSVICGNNQENAAYPSGLCAERVALFYANATYPDTAVQTIAVVAKGDLIAENECVSPCGSCRQVMIQSESRQEKPIRIILVAQNGKALVFGKASDLLIFAFGTGKI
jgi:cytidine deaminase